MKKFALALVVLIGFLSVGLFSGKAIARQFYTCDSNDDNIFPYHFMCGSDPYDYGPAISNDSGSPGNKSIDLAPGTDHVYVDVGYNPSGIARNRAGGPESDVLIWSYANTGYDVIDGNLQSTSGDGTPRACPGSGGTPVVYNFEDNNKGTTPNGVDQSPYAFTGGSGYENCGQYSPMIYWTRSQNTNTNFNRKLKVNIKTDKNGTFCVRTTISVSYGGPLFPTGENGANHRYDAANYNNTASHVAKQSEPVCYTVHAKPQEINPNGGVTAVCTYYNGSPLDYVKVTVHDASRKSKYYRVFKYGVADVNQIAAGSLGAYNGSNQATATALFDGPGVFGDGYTDVPLIVRYYQNSNYTGLTGEDNNHGALNCIDNAPTTDFAPYCDHVTLYDLQDQDAGYRNQQVNYYGAVYEANPDGTTGPKVADIGPGWGSGNFSVYFNASPTAGYNNGYVIDVGATNTLTTGEQGSFGWVTRHYTPPCYQAACSVTAIGNVPNRGNTAEQAGQDFVVQAYIVNTAPGSLRGDINGDIRLGVGGGMIDEDGVVRNYPQWDPLSSYPGDPAYPVGGTRMALARSLGPGEGKVVTFRVRAHNAIEATSLKIRMVYEGKFWFGSSCSTPVNLYRHYTLTAHSQIGSQIDGSNNITGYNEEDPARLYYRVSVNDDEHVSDSGGGAGGVPATASWSLYKQGAQTIDTGSDSSRFVPNASPLVKDYGTKGSFDPGDYQAGDTYCVVMTVNNGVGWIGPGDDVANIASSTDQHCPVVKNKPYFKVYSGGISAGGSFKDPLISSTCPNPKGEGILGGYSSDEYRGSGPYYFGASAQLTALALDRITGVASGQAKYNSSPTSASFANTVNTTIHDSYDPSYGGEFGPNKGAVDTGQNHCLTNVEPDASKPQTDTGASIDLSGKQGQYVSHEPVLTISNSGTVSHNVSVFADHDVVINAGATDGIKYQDGGWTIKDVPSLVIRAKGNIYINSQVGTLDGVYIAAKSGGSISTCATGTALVPPNGAYYDTCNKQLTVHGSFVADYINLMRTYGTMRNEKPITSNSKIVNGKDWTSCISEVQATYPCAVSGNGVYSYVNYDASYKVNGITTNDYSLTLNYSNNIGSKGYAGWPPPSGSSYKYKVEIYVNGNKVDQASLMTSASAQVVNFNLGTVPDGSTIRIVWNNNQWIDKDGNADEIAPIDTAYDPNLQINSFTLTPLSTGLPASLNCSNNGSGNVGLGARRTFMRTVPGASSGSTCAAEVFDFSPEQYLSHPAVMPVSDGRIPWDSVTSLSPRL